MHNIGRVGEVLVYEQDKFPAKGADPCLAHPLQKGGDLSVGFLDTPWFPSPRRKIKHERRCAMEIEYMFYFKLRRKPKTKKVTVVVEDEQ